MLEYSGTTVVMWSVPDRHVWNMAAFSWFKVTKILCLGMEIMSDIRKCKIRQGVCVCVCVCMSESVYV